LPARFPLFKGATRVATIAGVPLIPLVALVTGVASAGMVLGVGWFVLLVPGWLLMARVTRTDDRAFWVLWLWMQTRFANRFRQLRFGTWLEFWGASSYAPSDGRARTYAREGGPWGR